MVIVTRSQNARKLSTTTVVPGTLVGAKKKLFGKLYLSHPLKTDEKKIYRPLLQLKIHVNSQRKFQFAWQMTSPSPCDKINKIYKPYVQGSSFDQLSVPAPVSLIEVRSVLLFLKRNSHVLGFIFGLSFCYLAQVHLSM